MDINKNKLYESMLQLTDEQQRLVWDYIVKTAEANMALRRITAEGTDELKLEEDAGNAGFSGAVGSLAAVTDRMEFDIFHTVSSRFCRKDFGAATESEVKANIDAMMLKQGRVLGRYFIGGTNVCIVLDYSRPEGSSGRYMVNVCLQEEYDAV